MMMMLMLSLLPLYRQVHDNLETICNEVIDTCLYKGSRDNMSIIIIAFPSAPKVDPAAQKVEEDLNASLEKRVTEIIASHDNEIELQMVHQRLSDEELVGLPPGGGLASKKKCSSRTSTRGCCP